MTKSGGSVFILMMGFLLTATPNSQAHLMAEQKGTLNVADGGAFLVLSAPVSAFKGVDDNKDGALSTEELSNHLDHVKQQIYQGIQLLNESGTSLPLRGLLLSLVHVDGNLSNPATQIMALGRFAVKDYMASFNLGVTLQGKAPKENKITITATRNGRSHKMVFTLDDDQHLLFPINPLAQ